MILIDAVFINNGGGKVLLDYLVFELEKSNIEVFYLLDSRIANDQYYKSLSNKTFIKPTLLNRFFFILRIKLHLKKSFVLVICLY